MTVENGGRQSGDPLPDDAGEGPADPPTARRPWVRWISRAFAVAVVVAVGIVLWGQREVASDALRAMSPWLVALSLLLAVIGTWLPGVVWRDLLSNQGYPTTPLAGQRAFFLAQLGKYLPGGIWSLVAQVAMARGLRIPARQAATATFVTLAVSIISALLLAGAVLPFVLPGLATTYWWIFLALPPLAALLHPRVVTWWSATAFRLLRRPGDPVRLSWAVLLRACLVSLGSWLALGLHFGVLITAVDDAGPSLWVLSIGVFALAWVAGFLFVVAPAGAGVREAALVLGFAAVLPAGAVLTAAVLSRVLLMLADVLLAVGMTVSAQVSWRGRSSSEAGAIDAG